MKERLVNYFDINFMTNRVSHAFLIYNVSYDDIKDILSEVIDKYFLSDTSYMNFGDVYHVKCVNGKVTKEEIIKLQDHFKFKGQYNTNRVYIIEEADKMNDYAANSLLKFLEEPNEGIYAFLICSNISKVLPTIKSRCQLLMVKEDVGFSLSSIDSNTIDKSLNFIKYLDKYKIDVFPFLNEFLDKKIDKDTCRDMVLVMKYFYYDVLNYVINNKLLYFNDYMDLVNLISKDSIKSIVNKLIVLNKSENMLEYNLNISLFFDKLVIDMVGEEK